MSWANKYTGIPFDDKGYDFNGCHCWGLCCLVFEQERNITLQQYADLYENAKDYEAIKATIHDEKETWQEVGRGDIQPFDLIIMRMNGLPVHIAIAIDKDNILHTYEGTKSITENISGLKYAKRILQVYRYAE